MQSPAPSEYFENIKFNYSFYTAKDSSVTIEYVNNNFLKCTGYAYSRAISTSFNGIIYALGGIDTTTITASGLITSTTGFKGIGTQLSNLNASNISGGTLNVAYGGLGLSTLAANQLLIGNDTNPITQSGNLTWDNTNNILSALKFAGSGAALTTLNASNISDGTLAVARGGTGVGTFTAGRIILGNGVNALTENAGLSWSTTTNTLTATNISGIHSGTGTALTALNSSNISSGTLAVSYGGTGANTFTAGRLLIGNGTTALTENANLTWTTATNTLNVTGTATATTVSATNIGIGITNPTTSSLEIVKTSVTASDLINMRYDATNGLRYQQAYVAANDVKYNVIAKNNNVDTNMLTYYKGNIGIGTTAPLVETNTTRLHIYNAVKSSILLDTTTTGTSTLEFRRGTEFDIQQDYRFINDTDSTLKLQYANNQAAYTDALAQLMWVLPNVTSGVLSVKNWKNTEFVGNVGIGKTFSTTLKLDVLGDAAISGTTTLGTLTNTTANITTGNITTANITSLNATRMNGSTQILIGDADYIGAALFFISTTGLDSSATKTVYTVNGVYQLAVSSLLPTGSKIELIFDNNAATFWAALNNTYTKENALTTGRYLANTTGTINVNYFATTVTTIGVIYGEWVQIKYPKRVAISNILFTPSTLPTAIIRGYLLGSNDGTTWDAVYSEFTVTAWTTLAERSLLPVGYTPNTKQYLFYRLVAEQIQGVTSGALGAVQSLAIATLRFTYNQNVAFIDSVLCIGDPVGGTTPEANCILDINGATNMQGSVNILGNVGVGVTDTTTYKLNVGGTLNTSGTITTSGEIITTAVRLAIVGYQPTLYLRHTNSAYRSAMIHCNGNLLYFLGAPYGGTPTQDNWGTVGSGQWPLTLNLTNNEANFGGAISTPSNITTSATFYYSGGSAGTALNLAANDGYAEVRVIRNSTSGYDHDMYINYAAGGGSRTRIYSNNSQTILCEYNNVYMNSGGYTYTGQINSVFYSRSMTNTDYLCIGSNTALGSYTSSWIDVAYGSFTAFHRCYTDDVLYTGENDETIDLFKNNYMGRVVIATGKIKTDSTRAKEPEPDKPKNEPISQEWYSSIDKDGITIEDTIPIVQLSRTKKDKRVFGVLGAPTRSTNNKNRLIVNSIGEGAICVSNTNGNIENGDFIQSSDLLGYGEKQDDDLLHNYTIAKATIDCNFELDSPYYQCHEIENGVRVAFIACSYHCG